ncbi:hypothetical protein LCGC14_1928590 [marine sediment metagenome]|uniref:Uncharacterized protein n=1 Tax=marine sediment metagenome TaxID=412755 RepID=A0A0F9ILG7_9ZZZZ
MKDKTITVVAKHEDRPIRKPTRTHQLYFDKDNNRRDRSVIYHDTPTEVPNNRFYRRRILKGDLKLADSAPPAVPKVKTRTTKKSEE